MKTTALMIAAVAFGLALRAAAADVEGNWEALSNTAVSVTGNIKIANDALTFAEGTRLGISADGSATGAWGDQQKPVAGKIYRLDPAADPALLNGNRLCGMPDDKATYVVLAPFDGGLSLLVYTDHAKPIPDASACAIYNYAR